MNIYQNTNHPHLYVRYVTVHELLLMFDDVFVSYPLRKLFTFGSKLEKVARHSEAAG